MSRPVGLTFPCFSQESETLCGALPSSPFQLAFSPTINGLSLRDAGLSKAATMNLSMSDFAEQKSIREILSLNPALSGGKREVNRAFKREKANDWRESKISDRIAGCSSPSPSSMITGNVCATIANSLTHDSSSATFGSALQMISQGPCLPGIPKHPTFAAHCQWLLERMVLGFRMFARKGYTDGMAGHISVRDPENPRTFWTVRTCHRSHFR